MVQKLHLLSLWILAMSLGYLMLQKQTVVITFNIYHALTGACNNTRSRLCGNYTQQLDTSNKNIIKGLVLWEGGFTGANTFGEELNVVCSAVQSTLHCKR